MKVLAPFALVLLAFPALAQDDRTWGCFWGESEDRMQCLFPATRM